MNHMPTNPCMPVDLYDCDPKHILLDHFLPNISIITFINAFYFFVDLINKFFWHLFSINQSPSHINTKTVIYKPRRIKVPDSCFPHNTAVSSYSNCLSIKFSVRLSISLTFITLPSPYCKINKSQTISRSLKCNVNTNVAVSRLLSDGSFRRFRHSCSKLRTTGKHGLERTSRSVPLCLVQIHIQIDRYHLDKDENSPELYVLKAVIQRMNNTLQLGQAYKQMLILPSPIIV
ncbi:hypothetical protein AGLY_004506 [Aphis glycines]|uniref:Uncharacterized protein n=1 Tax=Aphis glycines TaxID=307491 RepID=A0A6G0TZ64_APHGL|nr:hypothetical protein AGLY_004506 [Aphis glycines]